MMAPGTSSVSLKDILSRMSEGDILAHYLGIYEIPVLINSPLRKDKRPSFGLYSYDGKRIYYIDFSTRDRGGLFDLLGKLWNCSYKKVLEKIDKDISKGSNINVTTCTPCTISKISTHNSNTDLQCKIREWRDYDIEYWNSYGISLKWLKFAEVYPISHKIIIKNNNRYVFGADKHAYVFIERKEGKTTQKIYQPFNTSGFKWANKNDSSVLGLWTKVPANGKCLCICSSLKDALCLWSNINIPSICLQGEGYNMSNTAINELRRRFKRVYICLDNDKPGLKNAQKLSEETGFINVVLPNINNQKDISDIYKSVGKEEFIKVIKPLFNSFGQKD